MANLEPGSTERLIADAPTGAGSRSQEISIMSDTALVSLYVNSISSGSLTVSVYTLTDVGKEVLLFSFPVLVAGTTNLLLRRASVTMSRVRVQATYTGACDYEVYLRAISGGLSDARILGAGTFQVSQKDVTIVPSLIVPAALTDRAGMVLKNWSTSGDLYIAETAAKATTLLGWPLAARDALAMDIAAGVEIWAVSSAGTVDLRISEAGS